MQCHPWHAKRSFCPYMVHGCCSIEMFSWQDVQGGEEVSNEAVVWDHSKRRRGKEAKLRVQLAYRRRRVRRGDALIQRRSPSKGQRAARTR